jgi:hypothetical protein
LFPLLRLPFPELTDEIEALFWELGKLSHHASYDVPDFVSRHNVGQDEVIGLLPTATDNRAEVIRSLWFVAGRKVTVRKDMRRKLFIDYQDILPDDLAPLLILDASGRVRTTYDFWENRRQGLVRLRASDKRYDNLRIYVWERSGSKGSWRKNAKVLLEGLAAMVNSRPEENWLIVYHKKETIWIDIPKKLPALFHGNPGRLKFLQWGNHCATNAYKDIANVVLAGTLFYPQAAIEALGRAAAAQPASKGAFSQDDCNKVELGEHRHNILQALCRAAVRRCEGGGCPPCSAFVIASKNSGIPEALPEIFPGAAVEDWRPCKRELVGKTKEAFDFIVASLKARPAEAVTAASVRKALGGYDKTNFRKIRKSPVFVEALSDLGIFEVRRGREQAFAYSPTV